MCLLCFNIYAKTIFVDKSGSGDFLTINEGITEAEDGDIVQVRPGDYNEKVILNKSISLLGSGPNFTKIISQQEGIKISSNTTTIVSGFLITANEEGVYIYDDGIVTEIRNCIITGCSKGVYYDADDKYDDAKINLINNTFSGNISYAIFFDLYTTYYYDNYYSLIIGNIIVNNGYGIATDFAATIDYNNLYNNTTNYQDNITPGANNISIDPKFVNQAIGNYTLASDSPCINTGSPSPERLDPDGTRNDMGAYAGPYVVPFWPYSLQSGGPIITDMTVFPTSVSKGSKLRIKAKGRLP